MKRAYANRGAGHKRKPSERRAKRDDANREVQLPLDREELLGLMQDSLESLAVELGLLVAAGLLEDEVARCAGRGTSTNPTARTRGMAARGAS